MSLQVWLPLNGNLNNNGVANVTVTNNGATVDTNGKIGSCYYCSGSASSYINTNYSTNVGTGDFTIAMWIKIPKITSGSYYAVCTSKAGGAVSTGFGIYWNYSQKKFLWSTANGSQSQEIWMSTAVDSIVYDKWTHLVMVRNKNDARKGYFYINGTRYEIASIPTVLDITTGTNLLIGKCSDGNYPIKAYYNDFRIYDHALSAKEVKEISKGLILHMPLDNNGAGMPNLAKNPSTYSRKSSNVTFSNNQITIAAQPNQDTYFDIALSEALIENKEYTLSWYVEGLNSSDTAWGFPLFAQANPLSKVIYVKNGYNSITFTCNSTYAGQTVIFMDDLSGRPTTNSTPIIISKIKLEYGNKVTSWCPNSTDTLYTSLGYNTNTVYDTSGYCNNGTMNSSAINSAYVDSPRYQTSMNFNGNTNSILVPFNAMLGGSTDFTISIWLFKSSIGTKNYQTIFGGPSGFELDARNSSGTSPVYILWNWGKGTFTYEFNKWYMVTFVRTVNDSKLYINGELQITGSAGTIPSGNYYIGAWNSATQQNFEGNMSDFRIYATALSAEDIMELYKSPVSIDNGGTIHALAFTENGPNNNVSKQGIVSTGIDQAHYLVPNFSETGNLTGWTVGSGGVLTNGVIVLTGTNISVTSAAFPIGANDIICVEFTVSVPTPSTTTQGPGIYIGTQYGQTNRAISFNFSTNKYNTEGSGTSTNTYFLNSYNSASTNCVRTYIIGSDVDINKVPAAQRSVNTHDINIIRILSGTTTYIRTGYNSNSSMVINISNFKIYKINQHGICENAGEKSIGKGYLSFANYNEI